MSVIIRLQNLPWAANAADIRQYFQGLSIPEGGVHIVGGEKGDAFISFSTDEDARQAMLSDGGCIKDVQIRLLLSSRNEMQKVIETARQQSIQYSQVYMQQMQQPQIPIGGTLPPLTAKVLPQPQQQVRPPDRMVNMLRRNQPLMDAAEMIMVPLDKQQQPQLQQHPLLSPKWLENKDRDDKSHKRERTRSKSRDRRSKSSRSGGGGSRRDRSRSRDRRRRDRSRGRDRSRDRYRSGGGRNSSSRGSGGKSHRSRSPNGRGMAEGGGNKSVMQGDMQQQQASARSWNCQFDNSLQPHVADGHQMANSGPSGVGTTQQFGQFRTPPQPPIIATMPPNQYNQQQPPNAHDWTMGGGDQQPYVPDNDFRSDVYGSGAGSDDDEDDRQAEYDNNFHRRYNNDNAGGPPPGMRRGPPGQDYNQQQQQGYGGGPNNRGPRFHHKQPGGPQNRGGHRQFDDFRGGGAGGGGPRFANSHQQQQQQQQTPRYGRGGISEGGRPSRFSSVHDGGRPSRFNPVAPQHRNVGGGDDSNFSPDDNGNKRMPQQPPQRFNDRYRYDVRNAAAPQQAAATAHVDGLCVEVNNMSNHFSYGDVRKLFDGIHIDGSAIKIQKHRQGVAFVRFDNNHNKNLALRVNGNLYKGNHIVVKHLDDEAYERDNTDDRPYPSTTATPTIVDHVDLVDDDDEEDDDKKPTGPAQKKADDAAVTTDGGNAAAGGEKNTAAANDAPAATEADGQERNKAQQQPQQPDPPTKYLQLKQLPITVTEEEVLNEIDGGGDVRRVTFYPDGEFMGAALEFTGVDAAEAALKRFDCVLLGSTPVPVLRCSYKEYVQIKRKSGGGGRRFSGDGGGGGGGRHHHHHHQSHQANVPGPPVHPVPPVIRSNCLYVYGLPTTVTNTDITQFFGETSVLPDKIHIMLSKFGRPTGESYCEFGTAQQAQTAMAKDQCYMGPNLVYVEPISRSVMIQAITKPMQQINHTQDMSWGAGGGGPRHQHGGGPRQQHHHGGRGPPQQQQQQPAYGGGGGGGHNGHPYVRPHQQQQFMNNGGARGGGGGYTPRMRGPGPGPNAGPDGFGQPGCVVALDNVPYRADVQEIVDFFEGFELNSQNVIRRFNDFGKPTGEARVNLRNPQEAARAVRTLQNKPIFNRPVHLTLL